MPTVKICTAFEFEDSLLMMSREAPVLPPGCFWQIGMTYQDDLGGYHSKIKYILFSDCGDVIIELEACDAAVEDRERILSVMDSLGWVVDYDDNFESIRTTA